LERLLRNGLRPKLVYTIPAYQNPTSFVLTDARRRHLVSLANEFDFIVAADEVYQLLGFEGEAPCPDPLCYYDTAGKVISMGSFAKILAPALRLGWYQTSPAGAHLLTKIGNCGLLDSSGNLNPVISGIVDHFISNGSQDKHLDAVRSELTRRAKTLGDALRASLPSSATFLQPRGGYFIWITLPAGMDGAELLNTAIPLGVRFHAGERFGRGLSNFIRLSFSYYNAEDLALGAQRLGAAIAKHATSVPPKAISNTSSAVSIAVAGATGRLGSLIVAALNDATTTENGQAKLAASASLPPSSPEVTYTGALPRADATGTVAIPANTRVIIDVSLPAGTEALVKSLLQAAKNGGPTPALVVGVTGAVPVDLLKAYAAFAPVTLCSNFSVGVPMVLSLIESIGNTKLPSGWHAEVVETHHIAKLDAPSGTAKRITHALADAKIIPSPASQQAQNVSDGYAVHALRLGDVIGEHTVHLAGPGERISLTHTATQRNVFAHGAIRLAVWLSTQAKGFYSR
jgi:4-hydroxy-tetrahydrodipicolinate reductase